jgi:hypothetical protein
VETTGKGIEMTTKSPGRGRIRQITPRLERHTKNPYASGTVVKNIRAQPNRQYKGIYKTFDGKRYYYHSFCYTKQEADLTSEILRKEQGAHVRISKETKSSNGTHYVIWVRL